MQVDVVIEQRFYRCSKGLYWTDNAFPYSFWKRYLTVFDNVNIIARVQQISTPQEHWHKVCGDKVNFYPLPFYIGLKGFLLTLPTLISTLIKRRNTSRNIIYRVPGVLSLLYQVFASPRGQIFGAEVVGDPADTFSENANANILRPLIRNAFIAMLKWQCRKASSIAYVTETNLQKKYPPSAKAFQTHYSSIQLQEQDFLQRSTYKIEKTIKILCIGNLSQPYKGCDFMLRSVAQMRKKGIQIELTWIGGGALLSEMQSLAKTLGIYEHINFVGNVSERTEISSYIDNADFFILCSRQEGLPRVLIEAMARSLVCIATNVGGVPELLKKEHIIERDNINQLVNKMTNLSKLSEDELLEISVRNYTKSEEYEDKILAERRMQMYQSLLKMSS